MTGNRHHNRLAPAGFTLLEVLLVMVLIALAASAVILSLTGSGPQRELQLQSERVAAKVQLALDEAVLRGQQLGLEITAEGYRFLLLDPGSRHWQVLEADRHLGPVSLDEAIELRLDLSGFSLEVEETPRLFTGQGLFEEEAFYEDSGFEPDVQALSPQVLILSSGDYTPFELFLSWPDDPSLTGFRVAGDGLNPIRVEREEQP